MEVARVLGRPLDYTEDDIRREHPAAKKVEGSASA
jgi:hypothetical protein